MSRATWGGQGCCQPRASLRLPELEGLLQNLCEFSHSKLIWSVVLETRFTEHFSTCKACERLIL